MEKEEKFQRPRSRASTLRGREKTGEPGYLNENCWLVKTLSYAPYKRCQYCELKFRNCLFLHYQIISLVLILFFLVLSFLITGKISELVIISVFTLVIVYGYFFNKSTDKVVQAYFAQRKAKEALEELAKGFEQKVDEQTKEIRKAYEQEKRDKQRIKEMGEKLLETERKIKEDIIEAASQAEKRFFDYFSRSENLDKLKSKQKILMLAGRIKELEKELAKAQKGKRRKF